MHYARLAVYTPAIQLDGVKTINLRIDRGLVRAMATSHFRGVIINPENIGKTPEELVALWNELHPDAPVVTG